MGRGRQSRSRSRSRDRKSSKASGSRGTSGSERSSRVKGNSRSRSRDRKDRESRRDRDDKRDRHNHRRGDRERDRDRDRHRDRDRDRDRDRKRSRRHDDDGRDDDGRRGGRNNGGNPDEMWKQKSIDEDEQLKELDVDELLLDEEEEERRLEEQRRKRKEKLEALQRRKKAEEESVQRAKTAGAKESVGDNDDAEAPADNARGSGPGDSRSHPPNGNGRASPPNGEHFTTVSAVAAGTGESDDEDNDDDSGPIEITKEGSQGVNGLGNRGQDDDVDEDDESGARNEASAGRVVGEGKRASIPSPTAGVAAPMNGSTGVSSSELRAQQGKEDRPVFDMFSAASLSAAGGPGGRMGGKGGGGMGFLGDDGGGDQGNWTDGEGYYKTRVGEVIGGRYTVLGSVGQGVFSTVLKCLDTRAGPAAVGGASEVALKMIRNNDTMRKAAQKEVALLKELAEHDPANRKHCIRMLCSLEHKQHVVMVFESMQMNLRETLKKFGRKTGINIHAVQKYAKQLMAALKHMASRNLVHADIKPDNILVDQGFGSLKLADFGSAFRESDPDNDPTPYLVSRWYRAPEIVMGLEYDKAIDLWSVAVTLFELYKGSPVLPGVNNNEMLRRMMDFKGSVPTRMIKSHIRAFETMGGIRPHFTEGGQFMQQEPDPVTGQTTVRLVTVTTPSRPIKVDVMRSKGAQDKKDTVADLADFLDKCMSLDPRQRVSLQQCSAHSFLRR